MISGTPSKEDVEGEAGSVDIENVELTVMDDISSPESPLSGTPHSGKGDSSSEEDSSGSDEERYSVCSCAYIDLLYVYMYMYIHVCLTLLASFFLPSLISH